MSTKNTSDSFGSADIEKNVRENIFLEHGI